MELCNQHFSELLNQSISNHTVIFPVNCSSLCSTLQIFLRNKVNYVHSTESRLNYSLISYQFDTDDLT